MCICVIVRKIPKSKQIYPAQLEGSQLRAALVPAGYKIPILSKIVTQKSSHKKQSVERKTDRRRLYIIKKALMAMKTNLTNSVKSVVKHVTEKINVQIMNTGHQNSFMKQVQGRKNVQIVNTGHENTFATQVQGRKKRTGSEYKGSENTYETMCRKTKRKDYKVVQKGPVYVCSSCQQLFYRHC